MEPKTDAVYYNVVYETRDIQPKLVKVKRSWKWTY